MSGGFLERWSRRKADEGQTEPAAEPAEPVVESEPETPPPLSEAELAALPRLEDLTPESSLAPFLRAGVPSGLKNAAMRKMWLLTPAIRDHNDCAVDYHWDWNTPGGVPGSGGPLEPGAVQKMLKGLTEPRHRSALAPDEAEQPQAPEKTASQTVPDESPPAPAGAPPEAEQASVSMPQSAAQPTDPQNTAPRRRHGGAMPS